MSELELNPLELKMLEALRLANQYICGSILEAPTKEINDAIELAEWVGTPTPMKIKQYRKRRKPNKVGGGDRIQRIRSA